LTYGYDPLGRRKRLIEPAGGLFTYAFDAASRIILGKEGQVRLALACLLASTWLLGGCVIVSLAEVQAHGLADQIRVTEGTLRIAAAEHDQPGSGLAVLPGRNGPNSRHQGDGGRWAGGNGFYQPLSGARQRVARLDPGQLGIGHGGDLVRQFSVARLSGVELIRESTPSPGSAALVEHYSLTTGASKLPLERFP
jgi:hypothetical protein